MGLYSVYVKRSSPLTGTTGTPGVLRVTGYSCYISPFSLRDEIAKFTAEPQNIFYNATDFVTFESSAVPDHPFRLPYRMCVLSIPY